MNELERELYILRQKVEHSLANNLCSDHRDKQRGKPCLACQIEQLERRNATLQSRIVEAADLIDRATEGLYILGLSSGAPLAKRLKSFLSSKAESQ